MKDDDGVAEAIREAPPEKADDHGQGVVLRLRSITDASASSTALALAELEGRAVAVLADTDERRIVIVDLDDGGERAALAVDGAPAHVIVGDDGSIYTSLRDAAQVVALSLITIDGELRLREGTRVRTAAEPIALGFADGGRTLLVTCGWGRVLQARAIAPGGRDAEVALGREPRGLVVDPDGARVWVTHAVGSRVSVVSLESAAVVMERALHWRDDVGDGGGWRMTNVPRHAVQGIALAIAGDQVWAPMVLAYPGEDAVQSDGYGMSIDGLEPFFPHEPVLVALDREGGRARLRLTHEVVDADAARRSLARRRPAKAKPPCLLPRATAVDAAGGRVYVACSDLGQVIAYGLGSDRLSKDERGRWTIGAGVDALAIDATRGELWAWAPFDRRLARVGPSGEGGLGRESASFTLAATRPVDEAEGRRLFHKPTGHDGSSCATCHVDGRDDGIAWLSPRGVVQTPVLAGRVDETAPFGWHGDGTSLEDHIRRTFSRMRAPAPEDETLAALARWITRMPSWHPEATTWTAAEARGREVFHSARAGCDGCHVDGGTDGAQHRVLRGAPIDTPSLRYVGDTSPYMHDGRYATLREALVHTESRMGSTAALDEASIADLIAYLRVL